MSLAPNEETQDVILEDPTVADTQTNGPATVDTSLPATSQSATPSAPIPPTQTNSIIYDPPEPVPAINTSKISIQTYPLSTTPFPPRRTCPQRHAATKALLSLSTAYEPLIIHAARSQRSSSPSSATGDTGNGVSQEESGMLVIDDMLPAIDESEGDSDGYEGSGSRKGRAKRVRAGMKRKRTDVRADSGRVRQRGGKRRGEKLDRDDLRLIARAAEGVMGWEERDRGTK
ncbi:MAG: hypothetical protein M1830_010846, partial [Pleopsidium flavum]